MDIYLILSIINIILFLIVLFLIIFKSKFDLFGDPAPAPAKGAYPDAPSGYDNLLLSNGHGDMNIFSLTKLKGDIDNQITNALKDYTKTADADKRYLMTGSQFKIQATGDPDGKNCADNFYCPNQGSLGSVKYLTTNCNDGDSAILRTITQPGGDCNNFQSWKIYYF